MQAKGFSMPADFYARTAFKQYTVLRHSTMPPPAQPDLDAACTAQCAEELRMGYNDNGTPLATVKNTARAQH
jgi:hypothetical protein